VPVILTELINRGPRVSVQNLTITEKKGRRKGREGEEHIKKKKKSKGFLPMYIFSNCLLSS
jgi:hypothetical protein